jgi:hypothetical protein
MMNLDKQPYDLLNRPGMIRDARFHLLASRGASDAPERTLIQKYRATVAAWFSSLGEPVRQRLMQQPG